MVKVLLIYDTVSPAKVTGKVAEAVTAAMREQGASVDQYSVEQARAGSFGPSWAGVGWLSLLYLH